MQSGSVQEGMNEFSTDAGKGKIHGISKSRSSFLSINLKRVYESSADSDRYRYSLNAHCGPRGVSKERAHVDLWMKDAGASPKLRVWFGQTPGNGKSSGKSSFKESGTGPMSSGNLRRSSGREKTVTFLFAARDEDTQQCRRVKGIP